MAVHNSYYTNRFQDVTAFYKQEEAESQVRFLEQVLPLKQGDQILDLACGFGRHAIVLARKGYAVTGYDQSVDYIARARAEAARLGVEIAFETFDMRTLDLVEKFNVVLSLSSSLAFYDESTNVDIFKRIHRALRPGGRFLYDQGNLFAVAAWAANQKDLSETLSDGRIHRRRVTFDAHRCIASSRSAIEGEGETIESGWDLRYYSLPEIRHVVSDAGFEVVKTFGDYDASPYATHSARMICVMRSQ